MIITRRRGVVWRTTALFGLLFLIGVGGFVLMSQQRANADSLISGLWLTGVDGNNNKLGENSVDPHWVIDRAYRDDKVNTCQKGYDAGGNIASIPTTDGSNFQTRTVTSKTAGYTGYYIGRSDPNYSGQKTLIGDNAWNSSNKKIWAIQKSNANWISFNFLGQNYSDTKCSDPTQADPANSIGNIYVFKLKSPINVKNNVDLSSIQMTMQGASDNQVKVVVNNCEMQGTQRMQANNWQEPDYNSPTASFAVVASTTIGGAGCNPTDLANGGFHYGDNTLSVYVKSTYGMTGLIIWGYTISANTLSYTLSPSATMSADTATIGQTVGVSYKVKNDQVNGASSLATNWAVREVFIPAGTAIPSEFNSYKDDSSGCDYYTSRGGGIKCKDLTSGSGKLFTANTSSAISDTGQDSFAVVGYNPGDRVCRVLSVDSRDQSSAPHNRDSALGCVVIAKTPFVQFWGGDVRVGDNIAGVKSTQANALTSSKNIGGNTLGSWAEYGIFAPTGGTISSASGGALSGKTGFAGSATESDMSKLSFANTATPKGDWSAPATISSYETSLGLSDGGSTAAQSISVDSYRGKVTLTNGGTVNVHGTLTGGSLMLLYPTGTVVIDGNILLGTNSYSSPSDLSQIIIQAKNIIINHDVDRVDAWLIGVAQNGTDGGVISTCDSIVTPYYSGLNSKGVCNQKPLRINGPVMGREVQLRRMFGAEGNGTPAETIDLRADAYLWTMQAASDGSIDTIFTTELPPRF